jgi:hypothetical protein
MNFSYPILKREKADDLYVRLSQGHKTAGIADEQVIGDGPYVLDGVDLQALYQALKHLWSRCKGSNKSAIFEAEGSTLVHSAMPNLPAYVATDPEFWMWLTFIPCDGKFADLVVQRFGKDAKSVNFSLGGLPESLYFRLWWRGSRGRDDNYDIAKRGDMDLWRSHIIRIESFNSDMMLKAFVKTIMPEPNQVKVPLKQTIIRALAPKITARHASCAYETLTEDQCLGLIDSLLREVTEEAKNG